jgi:hypothetical protein
MASLIRCDEFWSYNAEFQACGAQCALLIGGVLHLKPEHLQSFAMRFPNMRRVKHGASPGEFNGLFMLTDEQRQTQALRLLANCNVRTIPLGHAGGWRCLHVQLAPISCPQRVGQAEQSLQNQLLRVMQQRQGQGAVVGQGAGAAGERATSPGATGNATGGRPGSPGGLVRGADAWVMRANEAKRRNTEPMMPSQGYGGGGYMVQPGMLPGQGPGSATGDWKCANCGNINFAFRDKCNRCNTSRPGAKVYGPVSANERRICPFTVMLMRVPSHASELQVAEALLVFGELAPGGIKFHRQGAKFKQRRVRMPPDGLALHAFCRFLRPASASAALQRSEVLILGSPVQINPAFMRGAMPADLDGNGISFGVQPGQPAGAGGPGGAGDMGGAGGLHGNLSGGGSMMAGANLGANLGGSMMAGAGIGGPTNLGSNLGMNLGGGPNNNMGGAMAGTNLGMNLGGGMAGQGGAGGAGGMGMGGARQMGMGGQQQPGMPPLPSYSGGMGGGGMGGGGMGGGGQGGMGGSQQHAIMPPLPPSSCSGAMMGTGASSAMMGAGGMGDALVTRAPYTASQLEALQMQMSEMGMGGSAHGSSNGSFKSQLSSESGAQHGASEPTVPIDATSFLCACLPLLCQLDSFKAQVLRIAPTSDALVVGLQGAMRALAQSSTALSSPQGLRSHLPSMVVDGARLKLSGASDVGEAFEALVGLFTESADQRFVSCVEHHFSMSIMEMCECTCDEMLEPLHYRQSTAYVSVPLLLQQLASGPATAAGALTSQLASSAGPLCPTYNCGNRMQILRYLMQPMPGLLPVGLSWETVPPAPPVVHQLLRALPTSIDMQHAFKSAPQPATAMLRGVLCSSQHAQHGVGACASFAFDPALGGWVHSVDGAVLGGDWASVAAVCSEQHYKPGLLLYQVNPSQF